MTYVSVRKGVWMKYKYCGVAVLVAILVANTSYRGFFGDDFVALAFGVPLFRPLLYLLFLIAIPFLHDAQKLVIVALRFEKIVISQFVHFFFSSPLNCRQLPLN
jgi:hypothetical protein